MGMDQLDMRIVHRLRADGRLPYSQLARELGYPTSTIKRRVDAMILRGDIGGFTIADKPKDPSAPDFSGTEAVVEVFCRGNVSTTELTRLLEGIDGISLAVAVAGTADAVAILRVANNAALGVAVEELRRSPKIERTRTSVILNYLYPPDGEREEAFSPARRHIDSSH